jgi:hypothetical protein
MEGARKAFADMGLDENVAEDVGKLIGVGNTVKLFDALANGSKEHQFLDDGVLLQEHLRLYTTLRLVMQ